MKNNSSDFCVRKGDDVNLRKWPTRVDPVYKSAKQYAKLLEHHVTQLSAMQQLHYATNRNAILLIFQAMDGALLYPLSTFDAAALPTDGTRRVVFHCGSGKRSLAAAEKRLVAGQSHAAHMGGGIADRWPARDCFGWGPVTGRGRTLHSRTGYP